MHTTAITCLPGVGTSTAETLEKIDIASVMDLLLHLPRDYEDRSTICPIAHAQDGKSALFEGVVTDSQPAKGKVSFQVTLSDASGSIFLKFFKTYPGLSEKLAIGNRVRIFGEVKFTRFGSQIMHPECNKVTENTPLPPKQLTPVYPTTKGLTQNKLRTLIKSALKLANQQHFFDTFLQQDVGLTDKTGLPIQLTLQQALRCLHTPAAHEDSHYLLSNHPALQRLKLEELCAHQVSLLHKKQLQQANKAPRCVKDSLLARKLIANLPFSLTNAQTKVLAEINDDITSSKPMLRLVQGDVGSGKTLVAALAACQALDAGWQVAVMAPTEILAEQHFENFSQWFEPLGISVGWLCGKLSAKQKRETLEKVANNDVELIVGTHALFSQNVEYAKLGMMIVDEQHRFGVGQRLAMRDKGVKTANGIATPHQLVMTATPIPRTLAMSVYGDMDTSVIDELPPGRTPVTTLTVSNTRREQVIERIASNCSDGKQAYWVCPLVEESETLAAAAAESTYELLQDTLDISVGLVHGKMKADEKQAVMQKFYANEIKLLVATTVIEVGVNVPNASLMVIENAERLGLSQLHQLRGRVGRGSEKSFCVLMYKTPLSENGQSRLGVMKSSNDGFYIAEQDLLLRGPGELIGKRQSGNIGFYVADLQCDQELLPQAKQLAQLLLNKNTLLQNNNQTDSNHLIHNLDAFVSMWLGKAKDYHHV